MAVEETLVRNIVAYAIPREIPLAPPTLLYHPDLIQAIEGVRQQDGEQAERFLENLRIGFHGLALPSDVPFVQAWRRVEATKREAIARSPIEHVNHLMTGARQLYAGEGNIHWDFPLHNQAQTLFAVNGEVLRPFEAGDRGDYSDIEVWNRRDFSNIDFTQLPAGHLRALLDQVPRLLAGADFTEANLAGADLRGANLAGADLRGVRGLHQARAVRGADFRGARFTWGTGWYHRGKLARCGAFVK